MFDLQGLMGKKIFISTKVQSKTGIHCHLIHQIFQVLFILLVHMCMRDNKQYIEHIYKENKEKHVKCNKLTAKTNAKYTQLTIEKDDKHTYS